MEDSAQHYCNVIPGNPDPVPGSLTRNPGNSNLWIPAFAGMTEKETKD